MSGTYDNYRAWNDGAYEGRIAPYIKKSKLTPAQRLEISYRRGEGATLKELALEYGVSSATIHSNPILERPYGV